jgi:hypothetical protein
MQNKIVLCTNGFTISVQSYKVYIPQKNGLHLEFDIKTRPKNCFRYLTVIIVPRKVTKLFKFDLRQK